METERRVKLTNSGPCMRSGHAQGSAATEEAASRGRFGLVGWASGVAIHRQTADGQPRTTFRRDLCSTSTRAGCVAMRLRPHPYLACGARRSLKGWKEGDGPSRGAEWPYQDPQDEFDNGALEEGPQDE
jgi:hypothetical protein